MIRLLSAAFAAMLVPLIAGADPAPCRSAAQTDGQTCTRQGFGKVITITATPEASATLKTTAPRGQMKILSVSEATASSDGSIRIFGNRASTAPDACASRIRLKFDPIERRSRYLVCYNDLSELEGENVDRLYRRIEAASLRFCRDTGAQVGRERNRCRRDAIERAVFDIGASGLSAYHNEAIGRPRLSVPVGTAFTR